MADDLCRKTKTCVKFVLFISRLSHNWSGGC